jgi:hypothetical protein
VSIGQYLVGVSLGIICLGPVLLGGRRLRMRLMPSALGSEAWVADGVVVVALLVLVCEATGVLGVLDRLGVTIGCVVAGSLAWLAGERSARRVHRTASTVGIGLHTWAMVATAVVAAAWFGWTVHAYGHGMETVDTLWYHLPFAARFAQLGNIVHLHYVDRDPVTVFYPANSELLHALGLVWFRTDVLSPLINIGWAALGVTAAWSIGRAVGRELPCLIATLIVLGTPGLVDTQPGGAYNDVACIALILSCAALLLGGAQGGELTLGRSFVAALAAGLALGTKFTVIAPSLALALGAVVISPRGRRMRHAGLWLAALFLLGCYWYLRNWVTAGNPLPGLSVHLGPLSLPAPRVLTPTFTVWQYLTNGHVWHVFFIPGFRQSLGLAWWALLFGGAVGAVGAFVWGSGRAVRMVGAVAIVSAAAFLLTPQFLGLPGAPIFFVANVRYAAVPLVLGLVLLPTVPVLRQGWGATALVGVLVLALGFTEVDPGVWPTGVKLHTFAPPIKGASALVGVLLAGLIPLGAWCAWRLRERARIARRPREQLVAVRALIPLVAVLAVGLIAGGGYALARAYSHHRYTQTQPLPAIYAWAQKQHHLRIGIIGLDLQYPLYGADETNYVQYIGAPAPHAGFQPITTCRAWRAAVDRGRYNWLLVTPFGFPLGTAVNQAPEVAWTGSSPAATAVLRETSARGELAVLYRIRGTLDPGRCPR